MEKIVLKGEFIKLGQALKAVGFVDSGVEAKIAIQDGKVKDFSVPDITIASKTFVFPCALSPCRIVVPSSNLIDSFL